MSLFLPNILCVPRNLLSLSLRIINVILYYLFYLKDCILDYVFHCYHISFQTSSTNKQIHVRIGVSTEESSALYLASGSEGVAGSSSSSAVTSTTTTSSGTSSSSNSLSGSDTAVVEDDPLPDVLLRVRERVASPPPPPHVCDRANKLSDVKHFTSTWLSVSAKSIE